MYVLISVSQILVEGLSDLETKRPLYCSAAKLQRGRCWVIINLRTEVVNLSLCVEAANLIVE